MNTLLLVIGIIGFSSTCISIVIVFRASSKKSIESLRMIALHERLFNLHTSVVSLSHTLDTMVQLPKKGEISISQLQDIARIARSQAFLIQEQFGYEYQKVDNWRYGQVVQSLDQEAINKSSLSGEID